MGPFVLRRLVWASLRPLCSPSGSQGCVHLTPSSRAPPLRLGACAHVSAPRAGLCIAGLVWTFFSSPYPPSASQGLCAFVLFLPALFVTGVVFSRPSAFFLVQLSHAYMTTGETIAWTIQTFVGKVISLLFKMLSRFVTAFLPRSKRL